MSKTLRDLRRPAPLTAAVLATSLLAGCTGVPRGVEPVRSFEAERYAGQWYEVMRLDHRFERGLTNVTATYSLKPDGTVGVVNRGLDREHCEWRSVEGYAHFQGAPDTASLSVTFFWPFAGGYHVFALDRENYAWAAVSGPTRGYLWILAREPELPADVRDALVEQARGLGFPVEELILVGHDTPDCPPPAS